jgi:hypothetical protein
MDEARFWEIVDQGLAAQLESLSDDDLRGFATVLAAVHQRAYRWDLWAAGYLALGGLSDDAFLDFRSWLISHGRETFERVLDDPDSLVELSWDDDEEDFSDAERWAYLVYQEWERRHGDTLDVESAIEYDGEPVGEPFPEDDDEWFAQHVPRLAARFQ